MQSRSIGGSFSTRYNRAVVGAIKKPQHHCYGFSKIYAF